MNEGNVPVDDFGAGYEESGAGWAQAAAAADHTGAAPATPVMSIDNFMVTPHAAHGSTYVVCAGGITHRGGPATAAGEVRLIIGASGPGIHNAEGAAEITLDVAPLQAGGTEPITESLQLDPGTWDVTAHLEHTVTYTYLAWASPVTVQVGGGHAVQAPAFDDKGALELSVEITAITRELGDLYRVHYVVNNAGAAVPPGIGVLGKLSGSSGTGHAENVVAEQSYNLPEPLPHGRSRDHYLTLEAVAAESVTASITLDPFGPNSVTATATATLDVRGAVVSFSPG